MNIKKYLVLIILQFCSFSFSESNPRILLIDSWFNTFNCGVIQTNFAQAKAFNDNNIFFMLVCWEQSHYETILKNTNIPYETFANNKFNRQNYKHILKDRILSICKKYNIDTVISLDWEDIPILKTIKSEIPIKLIFYRIASLLEDTLAQNLTTLDGIDGFIGNQDTVYAIKQSIAENNLRLNHVEAITPFWNEDRCAQFKTQETRKDYFLRRFNIILDNNPVLCTIANLSHPCKNYPLLLNAVHKLVHQHNQPVNVMIAGSGNLKKSLERQARELKIKEYIHFLGSIEDIPALLFHSDMHVLPSYFENFSLANLETAFMKKPIICADQTDSSRFVINQKTGILFSNNSVDDLVIKIQYLINDSQLRKVLGENAYLNLQELYSNKSLLNKWNAFLNKMR